MSYSTLQNPDDSSARIEEFTVKNFNSYIDAGDLIRVLLRFIAQQPALRNNPVVLVGESYGGMGATVMLNCLQHPSKFQQ